MRHGISVMAELLVGIGELAGALAYPFFELVVRAQEGGFGVLALGDVLQGFNSANDPPIPVAQRRCREEKPATAASELRKETLRFKRAVDQ